MPHLHRGVVLSALTLACVLGGPTPELVAAAERVAVVESLPGVRDRRRGSDRLPSGRGRGPLAPPSRRPGPARPAR